MFTYRHSHHPSRSFPVVRVYRRPGTGKSLLLRAIIAALQNKYEGEPGAVSVTASTGMAAVNIGGTFYFSTHLNPLYPSHAPVSRGLVGRPFDSVTAGRTIHSWGGVVPGQLDLDKQVKSVLACKPAHDRWRMAKVLIMDEGERPMPPIASVDVRVNGGSVSMVDGHLFDLLSKIASRLRKGGSNRFFGGMQVRADCT